MSKIMFSNIRGLLAQDRALDRSETNIFYNAYRSKRCENTPCFAIFCNNFVCKLR
jgi:hypothetical protein